MKNNFELKGKCIHNFFMDEKEIREKSISHCGRLCTGKFIAVQPLDGKKRVTKKCRMKKTKLLLLID